MCMMKDGCSGKMERTGGGQVDRTADGEVADIHYEYKCEECGRTELFL